MQAQKTRAEDTAQFRASAGEVHGEGVTPGEALSDLMKQLPESPNIPIVILPYNRGDAYFTDLQKLRLEELRVRRGSLTPAEREEWQRLVEAEFDATINRTKALQNAGL